jgi:sulfur relay (sulfurtransferase) DsrC/TusE family protein
MSKFLFALSFFTLLVACSSSKSVNTDEHMTDDKTSVSSAQVLISQEGPIKITYSEDADNYAISRSDINKEIANLRFVKRYFRYYQAINEKNEIQYFDDSLNVFDTVEDFYWTCGTVPHYTMTIVAQGNHFEVYSDETFFDMNNEEPAKEIARISMANADALMFINGEMTFNYTTNFGVGQENRLEPETLIAKKGDKYYFYGAPEVEYDEIIFTQHSPSLRTRNGQLFGLHNVIMPTFTEIGEFTHFITPVTLPTGEKALLDVFGKIYR